VQNITAGTRLTKSTLVTVSHAIERAALASAEDGPMVVVALFQRLPYFERERAVYERIARVAATTVVGMVGAKPSDLPAGSWAVVLDEDDDLAREWTVAVLTPRFGAALVARDREEVEDTAVTMESGRVFDGRWRFRRDDALHEVLRLRAALADRLPPAAQGAIDDVVARVRDLPATPGESRADAAVRMVVEQARRDRARLHDLRRPAGPDGGAPVRLTATEDMRRWSGADGVTATGTLPVAVLGVRVQHAEPLSEHLGRSAGTRRAETVISTVTSRLRPADRATRLAEDEFLLVLPALSQDDAIALAYRIGADIVAAGEHSPFLTATATAVLTVTRQRPLPVDRIREALRWAVDQGVPVATVND
jgi:DICT domain-containing protein/GGDEF domain-containing protein